MLVPEQVKAAKTLFKSRNRKENRTFAAVRKELADLCSGSRRCMYCDDSVADEVEHFRPKDLYPEVVFAWMNYLYACGPERNTQRRCAGMRAIRENNHPTVWWEMKRQRQRWEELAELFAHAPEFLEL